MKILIVKTSALGDIVHTFPAIDFIKSKFPHAIIHWVVERPFASLVQAHPHVDHAICIDTKAWRKKIFNSSARREIAQAWRELRQENYDLIFDLQANMKSGLITSLAKGRTKVGYTLPGVSEWPNVLCTNRRIEVPKGISVREDYLYLVQSHFDSLAPFNASSVMLKLTPQEKLQLDGWLKSLKSHNKPLVMVCPGSNWKNKQLSMEALEAFLKLLQKHLNCHFAITWASDEEKKQVTKLQANLQDVTLCDKMSLPQLQHLMAEMLLVISMDSLPLHLAATTATKTFSIFGPSMAARYAPTGEQNISYQGSCPYGRTFETRCPILRTCKSGACIRSISGQQLFEYYLKQAKTELTL